MFEWQDSNEVSPEMCEVDMMQVQQVDKGRQKGECTGNVVNDRTGQELIGVNNLNLRC